LIRPSLKLVQLLANPYDDLSIPQAFTSWVVAQQLETFMANACIATLPNHMEAGRDDAVPKLKAAICIHLCHVTGWISELVIACGDPAQVEDVLESVRVLIPDCFVLAFIRLEELQE
jgi:hypothetical protein